MRRNGQIMSALAVAGVALACAGPASADEHRGGEGHRDGGFRGDGHRSGGEWRGGHIERFHEHDFDRWRGGHWQHGYHGSRYGWWWLAGGLWYFYPSPVYPYPDPYLPPLVEVPVPMPAPAPAMPATPPPAQYWYYCDSAGGYYPYVPTCQGGWRAVPANPAR
jgi:hypothetical protein